MSVWQADDVIVEADSSLSASEEEEEAEEVGDSENDIRQLKARRHALTNKLAQQQKRKDKIQVKQTYMLIIIGIQIWELIVMGIPLYV